MKDFDIQELVDNALLDGVNEGSVFLKGKKFQAKKWCDKCRGHEKQHFCECGEEISAKQCGLKNGFCVECMSLPIPVNS